MLTFAWESGYGCGCGWGCDCGCGCGWGWGCGGEYGWVGIGWPLYCPLPPLYWPLLSYDGFGWILPLPPPPKIDEH